MLLQEFYRLPPPRALSSSSLDKISNYSHVKLQTACVVRPLEAQKKKSAQKLSKIIHKKEYLDRE